MHFCDFWRLTSERDSSNPLVFEDFIVKLHAHPDANCWSLLGNAGFSVKKFPNFVIFCTFCGRSQYNPSSSQEGRTRRRTDGQRQFERRLRSHGDQSLAGSIDGDVYPRHSGRGKSAGGAGRRGCARARRSCGRRGDCGECGHGSGGADDERRWG